jgi:23S rRNA (uracil1939-C5)-methyltransferase
MGNGGVAFGRDDDNRMVFVPFGIPSEQVVVELTEEKKRFARGRIVELLKASPKRSEPPCPHFGTCSGCHFQHILYPEQLKFKQHVVREQLDRLGGISQAPVRPTIAHPSPWSYAAEIEFSPTKENKPGFWSSVINQVISIDTCLIIHERLLALIRDFDLILPGLWKLRLRIGKGDTLMAIIEIAGIDPPILEADFPISVAMLLPDGTAANLIGDNYLLQTINGRDFRISAGCHFHVSPPMSGKIVDTIINFLDLDGTENLLEFYSGAGILTSFLAPHVATITAVEINPDATRDAAYNLDNVDNISLYEGSVEEITPLLDIEPDVIIVDPPSAGLPPTIIDEIARRQPAKMIYSSSDVATFARDARRLIRAGFLLVEVQPIDVYPQNFQVQTVSYWNSATTDGGP